MCAKITNSNKANSTYYYFSYGRKLLFRYNMSRYLVVYWCFFYLTLNYCRHQTRFTSFFLVIPYLLCSLVMLLFAVSIIITITCCYVSQLKMYQTQKNDFTWTFLFTYTTQIKQQKYNVYNLENVFFKVLQFILRYDNVLFLCQLIGRNNLIVNRQNVVKIPIFNVLIVFKMHVLLYILPGYSLVFFILHYIFKVAICIETADDSLYPLLSLAPHTLSSLYFLSPPSHISLLSQQNL